MFVLACAAICCASGAPGIAWLIPSVCFASDTVRAFRCVSIVLHTLLATPANRTRAQVQSYLLPLLERRAASVPKALGTAELLLAAGTFT